MQTQHQAQVQLDVRRVTLDIRRQITAEAAAGIWTAQEAREKILALAESENQPGPSKRQKIVREPSPDWDSDFDDSAEEL